MESIIYVYKLDLLISCIQYIYILERILLFLNYKYIVISYQKIINNKYIVIFDKIWWLFDLLLSKSLVVYVPFIK